MRQFLVSSRAQHAINLVTGLYSIMGFMIMFIADNQELEQYLWIGVTANVSVITFLVYNIWVSMELDKKRRERTF